MAKWGEWPTEPKGVKQKTPMDMVKEFAEKTNQEADPVLYEELVMEEYREWLDELEPHKELKELADLVYVIYGYANAMGYNLDEAIKRVHENNLGRCIQPDGSVQRRADGKILKNKDYPKVDLTGLY